MLARRLLAPARALGALSAARRPLATAAPHAAKLEQLNAWILAEEADYLASKGETKSLDDIGGKAPLKLYGVSGRYATGLFNAAAAAKEAGKVDADLKRLVAAAHASATLLGFIESPTLSRAERAKGTKEVCATIGACATTTNFLAVLAESGRTKFLLNIAADYHKLTAAAAGELAVTLTTPHVLPDLVEKGILDEIKAEFFPWERVKIVRQYDPEIVSGYVVDFGDKILDKSYGSKLKKIKNALAGIDG